MLYIGLSISRAAAVTNHYSAPVTLLEHLNNVELPRLALASNPQHLQSHPASQPTTSTLLLEHAQVLSDLNITLCYGGEWHRYPSSFFAPEPAVQAVHFVKSDFSGILPKPFTHALASDGTVAAPEPVWAATRAQPSGFNDKNQEEWDRYVKPHACLCLALLCGIAADSDRDR